MQTMITKGTKIRHFDFAGVTHTYVEAVVRDNLPQGLLVEVTKDVYCGVERKSFRHGRVGRAFCFTATSCVIL